MAVEEHGLHSREQRVSAVEMAPSGLNHSNLRIGEEVNGLVQEIRLRDKVCVQNTDEIALGRGQTSLQCARLKAHPINAVNQFHIQAAPLQFADAARG